MAKQLILYYQRLYGESVYTIPKKTSDKESDDKASDSNCRLESDPQNNVISIWATPIKQ